MSEDDKPDCEHDWRLAWAADPNDARGWYPDNEYECECGAYGVVRNGEMEIVWSAS